MRACAVEVDEITHKQEFKIVEGENRNKIEDTQQNKATNGRTKGRKWSEQETKLLIDLLEEHTCLWDVYSKKYHLRNARGRACKKMKGELNIELADIKTKIMNLHSQLGREIAKSKAKKSGQGRSLDRAEANAISRRGHTETDCSY